MKTGRPRKINPVAEYLRSLVHSGKTTYEKLCVHYNLKFNTFMNTFNRDKLSYHCERTFRGDDIIPKRIWEDYENYCNKAAIAKKRTGKLKKDAGKSNED
jgi:hypothetical protein